jgi:hypothetical protein
MMTGGRKAAGWVLAAMMWLPALASAAEELNLEDGYWDTYVTIRARGGILPVPAIKSSKCITRDDPIPNSTHSASLNCRILDKRITGNDVSWRLECADDKGHMEGQGKITYAGKTFDGGMDMEVTQLEDGRHAKLNYVMRGERVRACDAAPAPQN